MNLTKERIAHNPAKRKLLVTLLFLFIAFICFSNVTSAQGWSFTFKQYALGNCGGVQPPTFTLPNLGIPTKSQCESIRQQILAIKGTSGNCTVGFTCTPCTGSDIISPAQLSASPGNVSFDGQFEGKPLFTTHESQAFQDWAEGYKQQLESYGITSILGKNITSNQIPLTGNMNFDKFYYSQSATFNPSTPPENLYTEDASVVDLRGKQGIVDPNDLKDTKPGKIEPDEALLGSFVPPVMSSIADNEIKAEEHPYIDIAQDITNTVAGTIIPPGWVGYGLKAGINLGFEDLRAAVDVYNGKPCPSTSTIITNALEKTAEGFVDDKLMLATKYIGIKSGFKPLNIYRAIKTYEWGQVAIEGTKTGYKLGTEIQK